MAIATIVPLAMRHARLGSQPWETRRNLIVNLLLVPDPAPRGRDLDALAAQVIAEAREAEGETLLRALLALRR